MLTHTFQHIPGVGKETEQLLWQADITSWSNLLNRHVYIEAHDRFDLIFHIRESLHRLKNRDIHYFARRLPFHLLWRLYHEFRDQAVFLDIETTGLTRLTDQITVVGIFDGQTYRSFVRGQNMEQLFHVLKRQNLLITYNGTRFDIPFIQDMFGPILEQSIHFDLRYPLRQLGYQGGLKAIEQRLGIERAPGIQELRGADAVELWKLHLKDHPGALETLIRYNAEDVISLVSLTDFVYQAQYNKLPVVMPTWNPSEPYILDLPYDYDLVTNLLVREPTGHD